MGRLVWVGMEGERLVLNCREGKGKLEGKGRYRSSGVWVKVQERVWCALGNKVQGRRWVGRRYHPASPWTLMRPGGGARRRGGDARCARRDTASAAARWEAREGARRQMEERGQGMLGRGKAGEWRA